MRFRTREYATGFRYVLALLAVGFALACLTADPAWCREQTESDAGRDSLRVTLASPDSVVVVYYHRTLRCQTCLMLEACAKKAVEKDFAKELMKGTIRWRAVDFEHPEHSGLEKKYGLDGSTLVLSHWKNKKEVSWGKMDEIWEISDDPEAVTESVKEQLRLCLAGKCDHKGPGVSDDGGGKKSKSAVRQL